jgi:hypothetical protein
MNISELDMGQFPEIPYPPNRIVLTTAEGFKPYDIFVTPARIRYSYRSRETEGQAIFAVSGIDVTDERFHKEVKGKITLDLKAINEYIRPQLNTLSPIAEVYCRPTEKTETYRRIHINLYNRPLNIADYVYEASEKELAPIRTAIFEAMNDILHRTQDELYVLGITREMIIYDFQNGIIKPNQQIIRKLLQIDPEYTFSSHVQSFSEIAYGSSHSYRLMHDEDIREKLNRDWTRQDFIDWENRDHPDSPFYLPPGSY